MLLYNRNKVRHRKDNYCWKKRKDGKTIREDHMKLKVQGLEVPIEEQRLRSAKIFERKIVNIFLLISFNICFWCSKEPSH